MGIYKIITGGENTFHTVVEIAIKIKLIILGLFKGLF
jgi:hypothetical protein